MKKSTMTSLMVPALCFLLAGCGVASFSHNSSSAAASSTESSTADTTVESSEGVMPEIENQEEQAESSNSEGSSLNNAMAGSVSWFPLELLDSNNWSAIAKDAEACGFKTSDYPGVKLIKGEKVAAPNEPGETHSNMAQIMLFDNSEEIKSVAIEDFSMDWSRISEYASENPSIEHFAVQYYDGALSNMAIGEMHLGARPVFISITYSDELNRTYIELSTYDSSGLGSSSSGNLYQDQLDFWSELKIIK